MHSKNEMFICIFYFTGDIILFHIVIEHEYTKTPSFFLVYLRRILSHLSFGNSHTDIVNSKHLSEATAIDL